MYIEDFYDAAYKYCCIGIPVRIEHDIIVPVETHMIWYFEDIVRIIVELSSFLVNRL